MSRTTRLGCLEMADESSFCEVSSTYDQRLAILGEPNFDGLNQTKTDAERTVQYANDGTMPIRGHKSDSEFSFDFWLPGHGSAITGANTRTDHELLLGHMLGASVAGGSGGTATGGTATVPTTASESLIVGQFGFFGSKGDGGGDGQAGVIGTDGAGSLTLLSALPAAMSNGHVIYGATTLHTNETFSAVAVQSYRVRPMSGNQQYALRGCWPKTLSFGSTGNSGLIRCSATMGVADWDPVAATFPSAVSVDAFNPAPNAGGSLVVEAVGTTTRTTYAARDFTVNVNLNVTPIMSPNGLSAVQTVTGAVRGPAEITLSFTVDAENATTSPTWAGRWDSDSQFYQVLYNCSGAAAGKKTAFYFPRCCIIDRKPVQMSMDGIARERITMRAYTSSVTTSELTLSAMRIGQG